MREIKFRGWDSKYSYMNYKVLVGNLDDQDDNYTAHAAWIDPFKVDYDCEPHWCNFDEHSSLILMQYTGLKDKNGKEIFEGDILEFKIYDFNLNRNGWTVRGQVKFACGQFVAFNIEGLCEVLAHGTSHMEVIGNIHENPELLEADK